MPQDRDSGRAASEWGRSTARRIAAALGTSMPGSASNECTLDGVRVVIKCARRGTKMLGVTDATLERVDRVLGALEVSDGGFELRWLDRETYRARMTQKRRDSLMGGQGHARRRVFEEEGHHLGHVTLGDEA